MVKVTVAGPRRVEMKLPVECPGCHRKFDIKLRDAAPGTVIPCGCGASIKLTGDDGRKAQAAMDKLLDTLHSIGRR